MRARMTNRRPLIHRLRRGARNPLIYIAALTLAYAAILAIRPSEAWFGVPGEWTWSGRPPAASTLGRWPPAIAVLAVTVAFAVVMDRRWQHTGRTARALALGGLALIIPTLQVLLKFIHYRYPLEFYLHRTIGPHNGFWQAAVGIDALSAYLRAYPDAMRAASPAFIHLATHPPGAVLYLWAWRQAFSALPGLAHTLAHAFRGYACADLGFVTLADAQIAAAAGQMIVPVWSGLAVVPLYAWARQVSGDRGGWRAAALYALLPTLSLFTMRWDTLYPLLTAAAFAALHRGLATGRARWWALAGIVVSVASFFSFGNAVLAPAVALYAALTLWFRERRPGALAAAWRGWAALLAGGYSVWAIFRLATGNSVWQLLDVTGAIQAALRGAYSYPQWLFYNLVDILAMTGFAVTVPFLIEAVRGLRHGTGHGAAAVPALTMAAVVLGLDLVGLSPGEVARLWLHLTTGMIVAATVWLGRSARRGAFAWLAVLLAFQGLWLSLFLRVSETGMPSYVPLPAPQTPAQLTTALARFDEGLILVDADVAPGVVAPGGTVEVALTWRTRQRTDRPYTVLVHLVDAEGAMVAQDDAMPAANTHPTTCWSPGETIRDGHTLTLPETVAPGAYRVLVGWYDLATMARVPLLGEGDNDVLALPQAVEVVVPR